jgi:hypothetical protein
MIPQRAPIRRRSTTLAAALVPLTLLGALHTATAAALTSSSAAPLHGAVFGAGQYGHPAISLTDPQALLSLKNLAAAGANAVAVPVVWYQNATNATTIFAMPEAPFTPLRTVSDAELAAVVSAAHAMGMSVTVHLVVDPNWDIAANLQSFDPIYPGAECLLYQLEKQAGVLPANATPPKCPSQPTSRAFIGCESPAVRALGHAPCDCVRVSVHSPCVVS